MLAVHCCGITNQLSNFILISNEIKNDFIFEPKLGGFDLLSSFGETSLKLNEKHVLGVRSTNPTEFVKTLP